MKVRISRAYIEEFGVCRTCTRDFGLHIPVHQALAARRRCGMVLRRGKSHHAYVFAECIVLPGGLSRKF